ncbi:MAG: HicB family protein [Rhizobiales bacterium 65-9]|nr:type II toxin-antitoxin system HicB family antitoxin [Hyphomicrobiales bacterium]OJY37304.1 MAG: HicB family protein [Rhizobiales bacterium 65-9]
MRTQRAIVVTQLSVEDGGNFLATVPDLPGCMIDGDTPEDAITNLRDAIKTWIEAARDLGREIPPSSATPSTK